MQYSAWSGGSSRRRMSPVMYGCNTGHMCTMYVHCMYNTCQMYVQHMYKTCTTHTQYTSCDGRHAADMKVSYNLTPTTLSYNRNYSCSFLLTWLTTEVLQKHPLPPITQPQSKLGRLKKSPTKGDFWCFFPPTSLLSQKKTVPDIAMLWQSTAGSSASYNR